MDWGLAAVFGLIAGAAGLLLFALTPIMRFADRVSHAAMPHAEDTAAHRGRRAREIHDAAIQSALTDAVISEKERDVLATLSTQLGLTPQDARAVERAAVFAVERR